MPRSRSDSGSSTSSGESETTSSGPDFDEKTEEIIETAPPEASIGQMLHHFTGLLYTKVEMYLRQQGAGVTSIKLLKISFHATFLADLNPALTRDGQAYSRVIVQVVGCELGDKELFGPVSAQNLLRASELAAQAGVRVPKIIAVSEIDTGMRGVKPLSFVVEEFIETQTVEDRVQAPEEQWERNHHEVEQKLSALSLEGVDTEPLPRFASLDMWLQWLAAQVPIWDAPLLEALILFIEHVRGVPPSPRAPVLIHQDLNSGNLLLSKRGEDWSLDAVIDWESAAIADPRLFSRGEPWASARHFAGVVKGSMIADRLAAGTLPRCELQQLVEHHERAAQALEKSTWLQYESWGMRAERGRVARATT